jgi:alpha-mannosidase
VRVPRLRAGTSYVAAAPDGSETPVQRTHDGRACFRATLPSLGHAVFHIRPGRSDTPAVRADRNGMENDRLRVAFDRQGRLRRVYDKAAAREVLAPRQRGNRFLLFQDKQVSCGEAWELEIYYNDKLLESDGRLESVEVVETGPVRSVVRFTRAISTSRISQDVVLTAGSPRLDFVTTVAWGDEKDVVLKAAFPLNVRAERARYEIQFGNVERPTHGNRPHDFGMFEVPAQRWADLSEPDYGVALLNDCKYGYDTRANVMRLTLLRAPRYPGENCDVNRTHVFTYSLYPHAGDFTNGVLRAAAGLNAPVTARVAAASRGPIGACLGRFGITGENVVIETVKKAEDDDDIVVRLYEAHGCRGRRTFSTRLPVRRAVEVDLLEREGRPLPLRNGKFPLAFKPYQVRTVKLRLDKRRLV